MKQTLINIYRLGTKELFSLKYDVALIFLICYTFTYGVYAPAKNAAFGMNNASVAIVDEDHSALSRRIGDALLPPYFMPPQSLEPHQIDRAMDNGKFTFVIDIPPNFEADVKSGRHPTVQVLADATVMTQAGVGVGYIEKIVTREVLATLSSGEIPDPAPVKLVTRMKYNPNIEFTSVISAMELINQITVLALFLSGAAITREREHGTIDHLLVMPLRPFEIMLAKFWANGLVIFCSAMLSFYFVCQGFLGLQVAGSVGLFALGLVFYLFSIISLGIFLGTIGRTLPQFSLLAFPILMIMIMLSGGNTPQENMPWLLRTAMQLMPSTHFVSIAQAVVYRGAGFDMVWRDFLASGLVGAFYFSASMLRFRKALTE